MKRFKLIRNEDISGVSGCGNVAEGVQFFDGSVTLKWITKVSSLGIYKNIEEVLAIHGHEGRTNLQWID